MKSETSTKFYLIKCKPNLMTFNIGRQRQQENMEDPSENMDQWFWLVCCGGGGVW